MTHVIPTSLLPFKKRLIGCFDNQSQNTMIFFSGIHGNEPAGVQASEWITEKLEENSDKINGNIYFIKGNCNALDKGIRYDFVDLNRIWKSKILKAAKHQKLEIAKEISELIELHDLIKTLIEYHSNAFYFFDLHTTSAPSIPFITISDSINNRQFAKYYNLPIILGIEEYLEGPLLTYLNEFGYVSLGFEAGQHNDYQSVENCKKFIALSLQKLGVINLNESKFVSSNHSKYYEIIERYALSQGDRFTMNGQFVNFQSIEKLNPIALHNNKLVKANRDGLIFMPLYQKQGDDGYFILNKVPKIWLRISRWLRKMKAHQLLRMVPGVNQDPVKKHILKVNTNVARFFTKHIFHLFGYRQKKKNGKRIHFIRRDRPITTFK